MTQFFGEKVKMTAWEKARGVPAWFIEILCLHRAYTIHGTPYDVQLYMHTYI